MARPLRIQEAGLTYHVTGRGNEKKPIFLDDLDRNRFLLLLTIVADHYQIDCHAVCQMTNHYHAVLTTKRANLSAAMQTLNGEYASVFNRYHRRVGHLFQDRFGAQIVQHGAYFLTVCRYVARNPLRAGMVSRPEEWPWSSYRATVGLCPKPDYLSVHGILGEFDDDADSAMQCYARFVMSQRPDRLPRDPVLGDRAFASRFTEAARRASSEVPRRQRNVEKISAREFFDGVLTRAERDAAIVRTYRAGFSQCEIARVLGVHYSTISKVVKRCQTLKKLAIQDLTPIAVAGEPGARP
jgi:putative transposase